MADVDMPDADTEVVSKGKVAAKSTKTAGADSGADGKKRFEVKKVGKNHFGVNIS